MMKLVHRLTKLQGCERMMGGVRVSGAVPPQSGPVAQLGARFHGMEEVVGSIPTRSTINSTTYRFFEQLFGSIW
jgi:hypothetical protein